MVRAENKVQDLSAAQTEEVQLKKFKDGMELLAQMTSAVVGGEEVTHRQTKAYYRVTQENSRVSVQ